MSPQIRGQIAIPVPSRIHPSKAGALARRIESGWLDDAACRDAKDPDAWFPDPAIPVGDLAEPLTVCAGCPVRRSCLAAALLGREHGIWGGTLPTQRTDGLTELSDGARVDPVLDQLLDALYDPNPAARNTADDGRSAA
jgi:hypothetical protein